MLASVYCNCRRDRTTYATIFVKPTALIISRATPPHRQNQPSVAVLTSDYVPETGNYNGRGLNCQAHACYPWWVSYCPISFSLSYRRDKLEFIGHLQQN